MVPGAFACIFKSSPGRYRIDRVLLAIPGFRCDPEIGWILPQRIGILKEPDLDFPSFGRFFYCFFYKEAHFITNWTPRYSKNCSSTQHCACCRELGNVISNFEPVGFAVGKYVSFRSNAWVNIQTTHRDIAPVTVNAGHQAATFYAEGRTKPVRCGQFKLPNVSFTADPVQSLSGIENVGRVCGTSRSPATIAMAIQHIAAWACYFILDRCAETAPVDCHVNSIRRNVSAGSDTPINRI